LKIKNTIFSKVIGKILILAGIGFSLSACAVGNQYDYNTQALDFDVKSTQKVGVAVVDQRAYVVLGEKTPDFVGLQRAGFGNPFDVTTKSGKPLADDMAKVIANSLQRNNVDAIVLKTKPTVDAMAAKKSLKMLKSTRLLIVYLSKLKSDTYLNPEFNYDVKAEVVDDKGSILAENKIAEFQALQGDPFEVVPAAYKKMLNQLVGDKKILDALK